MNVIIRKTSNEEAEDLADRHDADGAFVLWFAPDGTGIHSSFQGTPRAAQHLAGILRLMADDYERRSGFGGR